MSLRFLTSSNPSPADFTSAASVVLARRVLHVLLALCVFGCSSAWAADEDDKPEEKEEPKNERVKFDTKDRVTIVAQWYEGAGTKKTVPVIILHGFGEKRTQYDALAKSLQKQGHAVLVPDLRGHGESTDMAGTTLDPDRFRARELATMIYDIEAAKRFLWEKHNEGLLNIELLTVVGSEFGATLAMNWVAWDWHWPQRIPTQKQGQDVKAMVLISPMTSFKGYGVLPTIRSSPALAGKLVRDNNDKTVRVAGLLLYGSRDRDSASDARKLSRYWERNHPEEDDVKKRTFFEKQYNTALSGLKLLQAQSLQLDRTINGFIFVRQVSNAEFPWQQRARP